MKVFGSSVTSAPNGSAGVTGAGCAGVAAGALSGAGAGAGVATGALSGAGVWAAAAKAKAATRTAVLTAKNRRDIELSSSARGEGRAVIAILPWRAASTPAKSLAAAAETSGYWPPGGDWPYKLDPCQR